MKRDVIICLDLASDAGWAVFGLDGRLIASGVWDVGRRKGAHEGERWATWRWNVAALLAEYAGRVAALAYERPLLYARKGAGADYNTARVIFGQAAVAEAEAFVQVVEVITVQPSEMKQELAGSGNASKDMMIAAAEEKWGPLSIEADGTDATKKKRSDEADARAVGMYVLSHYDLAALAIGETKLTPEAAAKAREKAEKKAAAKARKKARKRAKGDG